jgi:hypothetical protein
MQWPFLVRRVAGRGIEDGDKWPSGVGLPKNLTRSDQLVIAIGFKSVLRFPQPK